MSSISSQFVWLWINLLTPIWMGRTRNLIKYAATNRINKVGHQIKAPKVPLIWIRVTNNNIATANSRFEVSLTESPKWQRLIFVLFGRFLLRSFISWIAIGINTVTKTQQIIIYRNLIIWKRSIFNIRISLSRTLIPINCLEIFT